MTKRETLLLQILAATTLVAIILWGAQSVLNDWSRLDQRYLALQRQASQLQLQLAQGAETSPGRRTSPAHMVWDRGQLPDPLVLARKVRPALDAQGISVKDFQVLSSAPAEFWLRYQLKGPATVVMSALRTLLEADPHLLTRRFTARIQDDRTYLFDWEVGYAAVP